MEDLRVLAFLHIFEPGILLFLGLSLLGKDIEFRRLVTYSIITGVFVWLTRGMFVKYAFGAHIIVIIIISVLFAVFIAKVPLRVAIVSILLSFAFLLGIDFLLVPFQVTLIGEMSQVLSKPYLHIIAGWMIASTLLVIALGVRYGQRKFKAGRTGL